MFCILLRKHLGCGKLSDVRQIGMDRVLELDFESMNEFGDRVTLTLVVEIMGAAQQHCFGQSRRQNH